MLKQLIRVWVFELIKVKILLYILPVAVFVAYSQLIVKWRSSIVSLNLASSDSIATKLLCYFSDPFIVSGYVMALLSSFLWLFVISRVSLSIGFPIYIGATFVFVIFGSWFFLGESISVTKFIACTIIMVGIILGVME